MGTPPNVAMAGLLEEHASRSVPFLEWRQWPFRFPVLLGLVYLLLTRVLCPVAGTSLASGADGLKDELEVWGFGRLPRSGWLSSLRPPCCGWEGDSS